MNRTVAIAIAILFATSVSPILGEEPPPRKRMHRQERRIENGVARGTVTRKEATRLEDQQETIHDERARALEDGKITRGERREIRHDQNAASRSIWRKKHNDRETR